MIPYPEQLAAVKTALKHSRGIIQMPTGTGKSITMALLIHALQLKTLVIVPNLELKHQLKRCFDKYLTGSNNIIVENIDSKSLNKVGDFDCLIIDEAHHAAAKTYRVLNQKYWNNIYYRFCFTATPWRTNSEEHLLMESITGGIIYSLPYSDAVLKGYILPIEAYYVNLPKKPVTGYSWSEVYSELVTKNHYRNLTIAHIMSSLIQNSKSTLCLVKEINHGAEIQHFLLKETGYYPPFITGDMNNNSITINKFNKNLNNRVLIGTTGVLGEGIDTKPAEYIIICGLGKSKGAFMQAVGRGVRVFGDKISCKVIIFRDPSHKWTMSHYNEQVKILKQEYGVIPIKLDLD